MYHDRLSSDTVPVLAVASGATKMPLHLLGTRAALFHLLKETAPPDSVPGRVFRRSGVGTARFSPPEEMPAPQLAGPADPVRASHNPVSKFWRDILLEDTFDFVKLGA